MINYLLTFVILLIVAEVLDVDEFIKDVGNHEEALNTAADLALTVSEHYKNIKIIRESNVTRTNFGHSVVTYCVDHLFVGRKIVKNRKCFL